MIEYMYYEAIAKSDPTSSASLIMVGALLLITAISFYGGFVFGHSEGLKDRRCA